MKIEAALGKAAEFSKVGQDYAAWEQLAELREQFPDDPKLGRELELLAPKVADFTKALDKARQFENRTPKQTGSALSWYPQGPQHPPPKQTRRRRRQTPGARNPPPRRRRPHRRSRRRAQPRAEITRHAPAIRGRDIASLGRGRFMIYELGYLIVDVTAWRLLSLPFKNQKSNIVNHKSGLRSLPADATSALRRSFPIIPKSADKSADSRIMNVTISCGTVGVHCEVARPR